MLQETGKRTKGSPVRESPIVNEEKILKKMGEDGRIYYALLALGAQRARSCMLKTTRVNYVNYTKYFPVSRGNMSHGFSHCNLRVYVYGSLREAAVGWGKVSTAR